MILDTDIIAIELAARQPDPSVAQLREALTRLLDDVRPMRAELRDLRPTVAERDVLKWLADLVRTRGLKDARAAAALDLIDRLLSARPA